MTSRPRLDRSGLKRGRAARPSTASHSRRRHPGEPAPCSEPLPPGRAHGLHIPALQLAFDSLHGPAPAGQRSNPSPHDRHLVYLNHDYAIDLHVEHLEAHDARPVLHGELVSRNDGPLARVPAFLLEGDSITGYDCTGELGQFTLQPPAASQVRLCLLLDSERCIDLAIDLRTAARAA